MNFTIERVEIDYVGIHDNEADTDLGMSLSEVKSFLYSLKLNKKQVDSIYDQLIGYEVVVLTDEGAFVQEVKRKPWSEFHDTSVDHEKKKGDVVSVGEVFIDGIDAMFNEVVKGNIFND
jgi:hypothetical protein